VSSTSYQPISAAPGEGVSALWTRFALPRQLIFNSLLVWYWALLYFQSHTQLVERFSLMYFAVTLPVLAFVLMNTHHVLSWRLDRLTGPLTLYIVIVAVVSLLRGDLATAYNVALFTAPIILILRHRLRLSLGLLNTLFILSIAGAVFTYSAGISEFGFLPGQSAMSADRGLEWRVSLFPVLPESAFFSLIVFLANLLHGKGLKRYAYGTAAAYFVVLSGNRTTLIVGLMCLAVLVFARRIEFRKRAFYRSLFVVLAIIFVAVVSMDAILVAIAFDNPYFANYVFRSQKEVVDVDEVAKTVYRSWLWQQHLQIFSDSPLIGEGTFYLPDMLKEQLLKSNIDTGSESLLTSLLARVGLMIVPLLVFFGRLCGRTMEWRDRLGYCLCLALLIYSLAYGSFLVPYNFVFLLSFAVLNGLKPGSPEQRTS
jgi:O-antigen ligase